MLASRVLITAGTPGHIYLDDKQAKWLRGGKKVEAAENGKRNQFRQHRREPRSKGLTSWPGRWTPLRIAWRTRPLSPGPSPQSRLSRRRRLSRRGFSRCRRSAPRWCTGRDAGTKTEDAGKRWLQIKIMWKPSLRRTSCRQVYWTW